jgi:hypothetical protein
VHSKDIELKLMSGGAEPVGSTPSEFREHLGDEIARFQKLALDIGLKRPSKK